MRWTPVRTRAADGRADRLEIGEPVGLDDLADVWSALALSSGRIFSTPEWAAAWWHTYGQGREPLVLPVVDGDGRVAAILPLYVTRRLGLRIARFIGHGAGDELGPVCAPPDHDEVSTILGRLPRSDRVSADLVLAEAIPEVERWHAVPGATVLHRTGSPTIRFEAADWDAYLATLSPNLRGQLRRRERRLLREHTAACRVTADAASLEHDLDTFFALHRARWGPASSLLGRSDFYRRFCTLALERGWLRLSFLEIDGQPAAAALDFRFGGVQFHYNSGRDPHWDEYSAGLVLRAMTLRDALTDGIAEYRFLRGDESYKARFANGDRGSMTFALAAPGRGRLALGIAAGLARSRHGRRILRRAGARG